MKYTELEIRFVPFFFFFLLANILENSFETRLGARAESGGETRAWEGERGREKNFLIGRIVEQPSAQSYNFSIVSKLPDSFLPGIPLVLA